MKIENIPIDLALQKITTLYREALSITRTTTIERIKKHFIFTVQLGYCYIEEALPHGDYARFYRVSNPGVEFADGDFIAEKLYSVERSAFLSSYKRLGEIYNKS